MAVKISPCIRTAEGRAAVGGWEDELSSEQLSGTFRLECPVDLGNRERKEQRGGRNANGWREKGPDFGFKDFIRDNPKGNGKALRF